jgi:predicted transcriptional regulator
MDRNTTIIQLIEKNPGIKFSEIMRETGMKNGVLSYYTTRLEGKGSVKVQRSAGETRFYPLFVTDEESCLIKSLRQETPRRILLSLLDGEKLTFAMIVQKVHKSQSTVSTYLSQLISHDIIETKIINLKKQFYIKNIDMAREIVQKYNPVLLDRTAYNLADTFSNL